MALEWVAPVFRTSQEFMDMYFHRLQPLCMPQRKVIFLLTEFKLYYCINTNDCPHPSRVWYSSLPADRIAGEARDRRRCLPARRSTAAGAEDGVGSAGKSQHGGPRLSKS